LARGEVIHCFVRPMASLAGKCGSSTRRLAHQRSARRSSGCDETTIHLQPLHSPGEQRPSHAHAGMYTLHYKTLSHILSSNALSS
ncbi:hypothetical protein BAE44_0007477, partial [Dichanthelium oligosanthes]